MRSLITTQTLIALRALIGLTLLTGVAYPLVITGIAQVVFPSQANGSLIRAADGSVSGSTLIGQAFSDPRYFWGRPSATGAFPYNAFDAASLTGSSGSNLGPRNPALYAAVAERVAALRAADPTNTAAVPVDLVTSSASGLDPHISPAAAEYQAARVARERGVSVAQVQALIAQYTDGRNFGVIGEPRVRVLELNLALDRELK